MTGLLFLPNAEFVFDLTLHALHAAGHAELLKAEPLTET